MIPAGSSAALSLLAESGRLFVIGQGRAAVACGKKTCTVNSLRLCRASWLRLVATRHHRRIACHVEQKGCSYYGRQLCCCPPLLPCDEFHSCMADCVHRLHYNSTPQIAFASITSRVKSAAVTAGEPFRLPPPQLFFQCLLLLAVHAI